MAEIDPEPVDGPEEGACALCGRDQPLTFHHLIPRHVHRKKRFQRMHTRAEMRSRGVMLCRLCHDAVHHLIPDEKELARSYNTLESLREHPGIARHVGWARKQK
ncbi:MAG: hypothetical protein U0800_19780 [Isosphaeraceae bacterium]